VKIYVAGKTDDWERVQTVQEMLKRLGHEITFDWTRNNNIESGGPDMGLTADDEFRRKCAENDIMGTDEADLLVMLCYPGLCGTLIEFGMAVMRRIPIIVVGEPERNSVFFSLDHVIRVGDDCCRDLRLLHNALHTALLTV
jgi:nucleoside 2-deoxyribosyltransferase